MAARNMLFYFGVFPLLFVGIGEEKKEENSSHDRAGFDFPRDVKDYRKFLKDIIDMARDEENDFFFEKLKDITDGQIVFGLLGIDHKSSFLSDRAIVIFRYQESIPEQIQTDPVEKKSVLKIASGNRSVSGTKRSGAKNRSGKQVPKSGHDIKTGSRKQQKQVSKTGSKVEKSAPENRSDA